MRLSKRSAFAETNTYFAAGGIGAPTHICGVSMLTRQGEPETVYSRSSNAVEVAGLSEKNDTMWSCSVVQAQNDETLRLVTALESSWAAKDVELLSAQSVTRELPADHDVVLRQMVNSTCEFTHLELAIPCVREIFATIAYAVTCGFKAVVECTSLEAFKMQESLTADVERAKLSIFELIDSANVSLGDGSSGTSAGSL